MQYQNPITIIKASGKKETFSEEKLFNSLEKSGLSEDVASQTINHLKRKLKPDMTTDQIYDQVSSFLHQNTSKINYFNYGLKRAVMSLGPTGYPFEILVSDLLKLDNFKTEVGVVTQGKCVTHEIDVIAQKGSDKYFIECKYHNSPGYKTDIGVALYTHARFLDLESVQKQTNPTQNNISWLITNTKVTSEVIDYCKCVDIKVTTWTHPAENGLQDMIISSGLHPVTVLEKISPKSTVSILSRGIVTCKRLKNSLLNHEVDDIFGEQERSDILKNISNICKENG